MAKYALVIICVILALPIVLLLGFVIFYFGYHILYRPILMTNNCIGGIEAAYLVDDRIVISAFSTGSRKEPIWIEFPLADFPKAGSGAKYAWVNYKRHQAALPTPPSAERDKIDLKVLGDKRIRGCSTMEFYCRFPPSSFRFGQLWATSVLDVDLLGVLSVAMSIGGMNSGAVDVEQGNAKVFSHKVL